VFGLYNTITQTDINLAIIRSKKGFIIDTFSMMVKFGITAAFITYALSTESFQNLLGMVYG